MKGLTNERLSAQAGESWPMGELGDAGEAGLLDGISGICPLHSAATF